MGGKILFFLNTCNTAETADNSNFRIIFFFSFLLIYFLNEANFFFKYLYSGLNGN